MAIDKKTVINDAQKFAAKGQFDKAIAEWKKIAKETPNDANVYNTIGDLCLKKNSKPEAVDAYQKAGDILAGDGFTSKAIALYKKVLNIDPKKIEAHLALADLNAEKGLTGNALESYKIVADHYAQHKEKNKALGIYQKMADLNPANIAFRLKVAEMYAREGMKLEAVKAYLQAADVHVAKEAFKDARQLFEKALALDPNNKNVYHKAGLVYFKEGKFVEACKALKPSFEADPSNGEIMELYLDALAKAGRAAEAADVYEKILAGEPERADIREKLYRLFLSQKDYGRAFSEVSSLANGKIESKDLDGAEELLKSFVAEAPRSVDGRRALSALYKTIGKGDQAAGELVGAAHLLIDDGDGEGAQDVLAKALELAPDDPEIKNLIESLQPKSQAAPKPAAAAPTAQSIAPVEPVEMEREAVEWAPPSAAAPEPSEEDPAIAGALSEIDVLVKYNLATKALEQLEGLAKKYPDSVQVRVKLRDIYGDIGNMTKAVNHMVVLADLYTRQGRDDDARQTLQAAREMDPNNAGLKAQAAPAAPPEEAPEMEFAGGFEIPHGAEEILFQDQDAVQEAVSGPAPGEISFDHPFTPDFEPQVAEPQAEAAMFEEPENITGHPAAAHQYVAPAHPEQETDVSELLAEAEFYFQQGLFDEARRHYEKVLELTPENKQARVRINEIRRDQENAKEFSKLAEAVDELEGLEAFAGSAPAGGDQAATSSSDEEAVRSLMQEIAQLKQKSSPPREQPFPPAAKSPAKPTAPPPSGPVPSSRPAEDDFFDLGAELNDMGSGSGQELVSAAPSAGGSDDFFDLASELRDELSSASIPAPSAAGGEDQSLDDIFEEFKKGVEQQSVKEDVDTHYNLGVAYKEMGLLDDAIGEFVMTPEDEPKFVQSRYMLGLCYMEKGDYQNAIGEIQQAMIFAESFNVPERDQIGMGYDLGLAHQGAGDSTSALKDFQKVYQMDRGYRDVAGKIKELQQGGAVSMEQLKNDIEREISSKFLAEGERIEREEKTRKNEKVRN